MSADHGRGEVGKAFPAGENHDFHDLSGLVTHIGLGSLAMRLCMCFPEVGGQAHAKYGKLLFNIYPTFLQKTYKLIYLLMNELPRYFS